MKNRKNLIALVLIAGIVSSFLMNGRWTGGVGEEPRISKKAGLSWKGVHPTHQSFSFSQIWADFFKKFEWKPPLVFTAEKPLLPFVYTCFFLATVFYPTISINAP